MRVVCFDGGDVLPGDGREGCGSFVGDPQGDRAGWVIPGQSGVLTGLSHGESGFALAFYRLYKATGKEK